MKQIDKPLACIAGVLLLGHIATPRAEEQTPPPPYVMSSASGVVIGVVWEEAAIRKALPDGVQPVADFAGGIVMYKTGRGYGLGAYTSTYFYVNVEGYDSPDGKANWMLQGVYGPEPKVAAALRAHYSLPVRAGTTRIEATSNGTRYVGMIDGHIIVTAQTRSGQCEAATAFEHYPAADPTDGRVRLLPIPEAGDWCEAELISLDVRPPARDAFSPFKVKSIKSVGEFKDWAFSFAPAQQLTKP